MISQYEGIKLIESEFPSLVTSYNNTSTSQNIFQPVQRLLDFARKAVEDYNLNLSRKCFSVLQRLFEKGESSVQKAVESSFIKSFTSFARQDETEKKRLKFFLPSEFYNLFLTRVERPQIRQVNQDLPANRKPENIIIRIATKEDQVFAKVITDEMCASALARGCGISRRSPLDIVAKIREGKAVIAVTPDNNWVGFSYIETYENNAFVSNSGLIVAPAYRNCGIAKTIKQRIFDLSRSLYPNAKIFSITTGSAVMKMNTRLGFEPVTYGEITKERKFWEGCKSCVNYQTLLGKDFKNCFCTAMLYNPEEEPEEESETEAEHFK